MRSAKRWVVGKALAVSIVALAAADNAQHRHDGAAHSAYADYTERDIKALSEQQIADYLAGRGMGLALAAELNRYPGPRHVLDLAEALQLSPQQRSATERIFQHMQHRAIALGERIVERERELDALFAQQTIDPEILATKLGEIARLQGELRNVHLGAHLQVRELLTPEQIQAYLRLRGYESARQHGHHRGG